VAPVPYYCASVLAALLLSAAGCTDVRIVGTVSTAGSGGGGQGGGDGGGGGAGGRGGSAPIEVLVWNNALEYGHASRVSGIPYLQAREAADNIRFDLTYAHKDPVAEIVSDTSFDASVFTDAGLDKYDVVLFLHTTGLTIDDNLRDTRRQALRDFIEKKGRGFVGTHSATDTYKGSAWPWYVDFIGTNYQAPPIGPYVPGVIRFFQNASHPILTAAGTPNPWNRSDEWFSFTRDPQSSMISGITVLLTVTVRDGQNTVERPTAWVHEMPRDPSGTRSGRLFYTACCHDIVTFQEPAVIDLIIAGIKWAAYRL
jgi:type 1 glutamine amidotransferase